MTKWLIVGLGNPGGNYRTTRHNAGFLVLDEIANQLAAPFHKKFGALVAQADIEGNPCVLLKPQNFMNLSGFATKSVAEYFQIPPSNIVVLHDDINFPVGKIKIKDNGSAGGHNGIKSIIQQLGTQNFVRIRIGVGSANQDVELKDWVLSRFEQNELPQILDLSHNVFEAAKLIITQSPAAAMNAFNGK